MSPNKLKFVVFPASLVIIIAFGYMSRSEIPKERDDSPEPKKNQNEEEVNYLPSTPYGNSVKPVKEKVITVTKGDGSSKVFLPSNNPYKDLVPSHPFSPGSMHPSMYKSKPVDKSLPPEQRYKGNKYFQTLAKQMQEMKKNKTLVVNSGAGLRAPNSGSANAGAGIIEQKETENGTDYVPRNFAGNPDLIDEQDVQNYDDPNALNYQEYVEQNFNQQRIEENNQRLQEEEYGLEEEAIIQDDPALIYERELERQAIEEEQYLEDQDYIQ